MSVRRLTVSDPREGVRLLVQQPNPRHATSLAEAQAAALVDGQLRRVGLRVSADAFRSAVGSAWGAAVLGVLGAVVATLTVVQPLLALLLGLWGLAAAGAALAGVPPLLARRGDSQNVVGNRAAEHEPRWRVVLLARLDTVPEPSAFALPLAHDGYVALGRCIAFALLALIAGLQLWYGGRVLPYLQLGPAAYLLLTLASTNGAAHRSSGTAGAGALAVLISAAEQLAGLQQVELWAVALGAANSGGLESLLARYPFTRGDTLLIALDRLDGGKLAFVTREGRLPELPSDPLLLELAAAADAADPFVDAEPRPARAPTLAAPLLARGYRALGLTSYDRPVATGLPDDPLAALDGQLISQATRLVVALTRALDQGRV